MESTIRTTTTTPALRRWFVLVLALLGITAAALPLGAGAAAGSDTLMPGETLRNEQAIRSSNGYQFVMQADGNAVIYKPTTTGRVAIWATNTPGRANSFLAMQTDGNLVLYSGSTPYWASGMKGSGSYLVMQTDGNLVMYRPNGTGGRTAVWASNTVQSTPPPTTPPPTTAPPATAPPAPSGSDVLQPGQTLRNEQAIRSSNGYQFVMQADGNAVIYKPTTTGRVAIWATNTPGRANSFLAMQTDGNLVLYSGSTPYWASGMKGSGSYLVMQTDGNLVMYRPNGTGGRTAVWASNTARTGSPAPTGSIRSKIRDIALAESKKNVRETNGDDKPRYGGAGGQLAPYNINAAWCASFATWVWQNAGVGNPRMINCGNGGAGTIQNWAEKNTKFRALSTGPRVGDLILFGSRNNCQHVTIVVEVDSRGWVRTVGGNESNAVTYTSTWRNPSTIKYGSSPAYGYASPVKD